MAYDVSTFVAEVARILKLGVNRLCCFSFVFKTDVFRFLFGSKGRPSPHKFGCLYSEQDFDPLIGFYALIG